MYVVIWKYTVNPESAVLFEGAYGPDGGWVALFRQASGYRDTELHRDATDALSFITIDRWDSAEAYEAFRREYADAYTRIDEACSALTVDEQYIGSYVTLTS